MADGMLSQEEIDALTKGIDSNASEASTPTTEEETAVDIAEPAETSATAAQSSDVVLTDIEKDTLGEIGNISMGSAATTLSLLLGHKVSITTPNVSLETMTEIKTHYPMPYLIVGVGYTAGIDGNNVLAIQAADAAVIADLMMGGDGTNIENSELDEIRKSAVSEAMNQMMGSVSTSLSQIFNKKIDISPPQIQVVDMATADTITDLWGNNEPIIKISFKMEVEGIIDSEIMQILPLKVSRELVESLTTATAAAVEKVSMPAESQSVPSAPEPAAQPVQPQMPVAHSAPSMQQPQAAPMQSPSVNSQAIVSNVPVQPAQFTPLSVGPVEVNNANINLILDVPLNVTVELGSTKKSIKEILDLSSGSVIELDKLAGEPVDILVNGRLLAKGEVVVIDENFGVRITDIASQAERAKKLQ